MGDLVKFETELPADILAELDELGLGDAPDIFGPSISINRISLANNKFTFIVDGEDIGIIDEEGLPPTSLFFLPVATMPAVGRIYYSSPYDGDGEGSGPDCFSEDGKIPSPAAPAPQSDKCASCRQNAKGSASNGSAKACSYIHNVVVMAAVKDGKNLRWIEGLFKLSLKGGSLFGNTPEGFYNWRGLVAMLKQNGARLQQVLVHARFNTSKGAPPNTLMFRPLSAAPVKLISKAISLWKEMDETTREAHIRVGPVTASADAEAVQDEAPAPEPKPEPKPEPEPKKKRATRKKTAAKPKPEPEPEPVADDGDDDGLVSFDDDDIPF